MRYCGIVTLVFLLQNNKGNNQILLIIKIAKKNISTSGLSLAYFIQRKEQESEYG